MGERGANRPRLSRWSLLWAVAGCSALAGLVFGVVIVGGFWPFGGWYQALLLPLIFTPLLTIVFTASQRPGRAASLLALLACAGVIALGLAAAGLLALAQTRDWIGDRCCEAAYSVPYATWEALMPVYAAAGVALLVLLLVALKGSRARPEATARLETQAP